MLSKLSIVSIAYQGSKVNCIHMIFMPYVTSFYNPQSSFGHSDRLMQELKSRRGIQESQWNAKKIGDKLCTLHIIKNLLSNLKFFSCMNVFYIQPAIKSHISSISKYRKFLISNRSGIMCFFRQKLIPLFDVSPNDEMPSILIQLIKMIRNLLPICLYCKISLS